MKKFDYYGGMFVSSVVLAVSVILAELYLPFKNVVLANVGGLVTLGTHVHHWPGKVVFVVASFLIGGFYLKKTDKQAWFATLGSIAAIVLFFLLHYFLA